jgi:hypothetical protein
MGPGDMEVQAARKRQAVARMAMNECKTGFSVSIVASVPLSLLNQYNSYRRFWSTVR